MIINMSGGGASGDKIVTVHVTPGTGANVTCTNDKKTFTGTTDANGDAIFKLSKGPWTITAECSGATFTENVNISENCTINISLEQIPVFTYTGDYEIVNDSDVTITSSLNNWKIRFLTSGTLTFTALNGAADGIDVFCVGGGGNGSSWGAYDSAAEMIRPAGAGGGGGYTTTKKGVSVDQDVSYDIVIGGATGKSSAFSVSAAGGKSASATSGGNGGSGGGKWGGNGGSDGGDGSYSGAGGKQGTGQGTTTREFGESGANLYSGGGAGAGGSAGAGGGGKAGKAGTANTGGGGGGINGTPPAGGSGIVIIRNARGVS